MWDLMYILWGYLSPITDYLSPATHHMYKRPAAQRIRSQAGFYLMSLSWSMISKRNNISGQISSTSHSLSNRKRITFNILTHCKVNEQQQEANILVAMFLPGQDQLAMGSKTIWPSKLRIRAEAKQKLTSKCHLGATKDTAKVTPIWLEPQIG